MTTGLSVFFAFRGESPAPIARTHSLAANPSHGPSNDGGFRVRHPATELSCPAGLYSRMYRTRKPPRPANAPFHLATLPNRKKHALPTHTIITKKAGFGRPNGTSDPQGQGATLSSFFIIVLHRLIASSSDFLRNHDLKIYNCKTNS